MSEDVCLFEFEGHPIRVIVRDGQPHFALCDVCAALGINEAEATAVLTAEDIAIVDIPPLAAEANTPNGPNRGTVH